MMLTSQGRGNMKPTSALRKSKPLPQVISLDISELFHSKFNFFFFSVGFFPPHQIF
jgi:hypothetical protein